MIIRTPYRLYVLDYPELEGDYWHRRLQLMNGTGIFDEDEKEIKVYPLKERYTTLSQLANSRRRNFIDENGQLVIYKPTRFFTVEYLPILERKVGQKGYSTIWSKLPCTFKIVDKGYTHFGYIKVGKAYILYDLCFEKKPKTKKKL